MCDVKEVLEEIQIGDLRWFTKSVCINTPYWRRSLKPGRGILVARIEEMNTEGLVEPPLPLPDHVGVDTRPVRERGTDEGKTTWAASDYFIGNR